MSNDPPFLTKDVMQHCDPLILSDGLEVHQGAHANAVFFETEDEMLIVSTMDEIRALRDWLNRALPVEPTGDDERLKLAIRALTVNTCWLAITVKDGGGFQGCYLPGPYSAHKLIGEVNRDPWVALKSAMAALDGLSENRTAEPR